MEAAVCLNKEYLLIYLAKFAHKSDYEFNISVLHTNCQLKEGAWLTFGFGLIPFPYEDYRCWYSYLNSFVSCSEASAEFININFRRDSFEILLKHSSRSNILRSWHPWNRCWWGWSRIQVRQLFRFNDIVNYLIVSFEGHTIYETNRLEKLCN